MIYTVEGLSEIGVDDIDLGVTVWMLSYELSNKNQITDRRSSTHETVLMLGNSNVNLSYDVVVKTKLK